MLHLGAFRCIPVPLLAYFHVSLLALRMQPPCEAAAGTSANKRGEKIAERRLHPTFLFYTGAYRRLIKRKLLTDLPFDPSLDQQEVIQFTFGSTSLCLAFKYAADVSPLLSFFFLSRRCHRDYNDRSHCCSFIMCCKVDAKGS